MPFCAFVAFTHLYLFLFLFSAIPVRVQLPLTDECISTLKGMRVLLPFLFSSFYLFILLLRACVYAFASLFLLVEYSGQLLIFMY